MPKQNNPDPNFDPASSVPDKLSRDPAEKAQQIQMFKDMSLVNKKIKDFNSGKSQDRDAVIAQLNKTLDTALKGQNSSNPDIRNQSIASLRVVESELKKLTSDLGDDKKDLMKVYSKVIAEAEKTNKTLEDLANRIVPDGRRKKPVGVKGAISDVGKYYLGAIFDNLDPTLQTAGRLAGQLHGIYKAHKASKQADVGTLSPKTKVTVPRAEKANMSKVSTPESTESSKIESGLKEALDSQSETLKKIFACLIEVEETAVEESIASEKRFSEQKTLQKEYHDQLLTEAKATVQLLTNVNDSLQALANIKHVEAAPPASSLTSVPVAQTTVQPAIKVDDTVTPSLVPEIKPDATRAEVPNALNAKSARGSDMAALTGLLSKLDAEFGEFDKLVKISEDTQTVEKEILKSLEESRSEAELQSLRAIEAAKESSKQSTVNKAGTRGIDTPKGHPGVLGVLAGVFGAISELLVQAKVPQLLKLVKDSSYVSSIKNFFAAFTGIADTIKSAGTYLKPVIGVGKSIIEYVKGLANVFGVFSKISGLAGFAEIGGKLLKAVPFVGTLISVITSIWDAATNSEKILGKAKVDFRDRLSVAVGSFIGGFVGLIDVVAGWFGEDTKLGDWTKEKVSKLVSKLLHPLDAISEIFTWIENSFTSLAKTYADNMPSILVPDGIKKIAAGQLSPSNSRTEQTKPIEQLNQETQDIKDKAAKSASIAINKPVTNNVNAGTTNVFAVPLSARNDDRSFLGSFQVGVMP